MADILSRRPRITRSAGEQHGQRPGARLPMTFRRPMHPRVAPELRTRIMPLPLHIFIRRILVFYEDRDAIRPYILFCNYHKLSKYLNFFTLYVYLGVLSKQRSRHRGSHEIEPIFDRFAPACPAKIFQAPQGGRSRRDRPRPRTSPSGGDARTRAAECRVRIDPSFASSRPSTIIARRKADVGHAKRAREPARRTSLFRQEPLSPAKPILCQLPPAHPGNRPGNGAAVSRAGVRRRR
jgi:hypothetical protein